MTEKYLKQRIGCYSDGSPRTIDVLNQTWLEEQSLDELKLLLFSEHGKEYSKVLFVYMRKKQAKERIEKGDMKCLNH